MSDWLWCYRNSKSLIFIVRKFLYFTVLRSSLGLALVYSNDLQQHHIQFCSMAGFPWCTHSYYTAIWHACVWVIWKDRNKRIFLNEASHSINLLEKIKDDSFLWMKANITSFNYNYMTGGHIRSFVWECTSNSYCLFF